MPQALDKSHLRLKVGDRVTVPGGEEGVIVRASTHSSFDWWVELPEKPGGIPSTEMPFDECSLTAATGADHA